MSLGPTTGDQETLQVVANAREDRLGRAIVHTNDFEPVVFVSAYENDIQLAVIACVPFAKMNFGGYVVTKAWTEFSLANASAPCSFKKGLLCLLRVTKYAKRSS